MTIITLLRRIGNPSLNGSGICHCPCLVLTACVSMRFRNCMSSREWASSSSLLVTSNNLLSVYGAIFWQFLHEPVRGNVSNCVIRVRMWAGLPLRFHPVWPVTVHPSDSLWAYGEPLGPFITCLTSRASETSLPLQVEQLDNVALILGILWRFFWGGVSGLRHYTWECLRGSRIYSYTRRGEEVGLVLLLCL